MLKEGVSLRGLIVIWLKSTFRAVDSTASICRRLDEAINITLLGKPDADLLGLFKENLIGGPGLVFPLSPTWPH